MDVRTQRRRRETVRDSAIRRTRNSHVFIRGTIIKKPALRLVNQSLYEYNVRNLPDFLPFRLRLEYRILSAGQHLGWVSPVEQNPARRVQEVVVSAVVNQKNALRSYDRRRSRLHDPGIE